MESLQVELRRATIEDIDALARLWRACDLDVSGLERRLTEFHVALDDEQRLLGAIGLRLQGGEGCLHTEAYHDVEGMNVAREALLERVGKMADALGLHRMWTTLDLPALGERAFEEPDEESMEAFPREFGDWRQNWRIALLRDPSAAPANLEKQLAMLTIQNRESSQQIVRSAKIVKGLMNGALILLAIAMVAMLAVLIQRYTRG